MITLCSCLWYHLFQKLRADFERVTFSRSDEREGGGGGKLFNFHNSWKYEIKIVKIVNFSAFRNTWFFMMWYKEELSKKHPNLLLANL